MQGHLSKIYELWREELINITANIEAYIDFPDDDVIAAFCKPLARQSRIKRM